MLDQINPKYHQYLQAAVPPEQWAAFNAISDEEKDHYLNQYLMQMGQTAPQPEPAPQVNPLSGKELIVNPKTNEITVPGDEFNQFGIVRSIDDLERIAVHVSNSKLGAKHYHNNPAAAFTTLMYGYEMKINPMVAIHAMHVIEGKLTASIHLIRSLLERAGVEIETVYRYEAMYDTQGGVADYMSRTTMRRKSGLTNRIIESTFDLSYIQCVQAKWGKKGPWETMPFIMLPTRNTVLHGREFYGSALNGMYEITEIKPSAELDEDLNMM